MTAEQKERTPFSNRRNPRPKFHRYSGLKVDGRSPTHVGLVSFKFHVEVCQLGIDPMRRWLHLDSATLQGINNPSFSAELASSEKKNEHPKPMTVLVGSSATCFLGAMMVRARLIEAYIAILVERKVTGFWVLSAHGPFKVWPKHSIYAFCGRGGRGDDRGRGVRY